jgi:hypothetical protein
MVLPALPLACHARASLKPMDLAIHLEHFLPKSDDPEWFCFSLLLGGFA